MKILTPVFILLLFVISCNRTWLGPNTTLPAAKVSIASLISVPNVYDGAGVAVKGMVWDIVNDELVYLLDSGHVEILNYSVFKLSDRNGNFVNIYTENIKDVKEGDIVGVVGIYRRDFVAERRNYTNEIEAKNIKILKSSKTKYSSGVDNPN